MNDANAKLDRARRLLDEGVPGLRELADAVGWSPAHLQRRFSARFGLSPADYLAQRKLGRLKQALRDGRDVTTALYDAGYGSPSRPSRYRQGGAGESLRWSVIDTALGRALVAATGRGICAIELGDDEAALEARLRREFPGARLERVDEGRDEFLAPRLAAVADALAGRAAEVELDLIGTAFQKRVWDALMRIPKGQTLSYAELADAVGLPRGARAVARACGGNRLAVVVPCHRVVRGDGSLGGYRWGLPLKQQVLARERA